MPTRAVVLATAPCSLVALASYCSVPSIKRASEPTPAQFVGVQSLHWLAAQASSTRCLSRTRREDRCSERDLQPHVCPSRHRPPTLKAAALSTHTHLPILFVRVRFVPSDIEDSMDMIGRRSDCPHRRPNMSMPAPDLRQFGARPAKKAAPLNTHTFAYLTSSASNCSPIQVQVAARSFQQCARAVVR